MGMFAEPGPRRRVKLDLTAEHVVAFLGKRGTGKSYSLGVLLEGLGANSGGSLAFGTDDRSAIVFDVLDIFWSSALPLRDDGSAELRKQYDRMVHARIVP